MADRLIELMAELFSVTPEDITPETDFYDDLYADSFDMLELSIILEEEFDLTKSELSSMAHFTTVGQVTDRLAELGKR